MSRRQNLRSFPRAAAPAPAAAGHRPLLLAVALAAGFSAVPAGAQPSGAQAVVGSATLSQQGNKLVVTTTNGAGNFSAINWQSFSVPGGTTTYVAQPGVSSTSINRVVGPDPSLIYGALGSNGRLVLVNPAGITVGAGAVVDTAAFTASTLKMTDADMLNGRLRFGNGLGNLLKVDGTVLASHGDVVLIGQQVETGPQALIQSQGATVLAAGQKVEITGRGVEGIVFEVQAPTDRAVNLGTLKGDAVGVFAGTLKHSGLIQAQAVTTEGGKVVLKAVDTSLVEGAIVAKGAAGAGGSVDVFGAKVGVLAGATVTTSNTASGGTIRVGGDYQGKNADVPNAQVTYVDKDATLRADATVNGNGGKVIVWADDTTRAYGTISANAGAQGGDGGLVETSGKRYLDANGARVSASAANGKAGTWLLDPESITIASTGLETILSGGGGLFEQLGIGISLLTQGTLQSALNTGTSVTVRTNPTIGSGSGDVTFQDTVTLERSALGATTLNIDAAGAIRFSGTGTTTFGATGGAGRTLNVNLNSTTGIVTDAGASVRLWTDNAGSDVKVVVTGGQTWTNNGALTLDQNGQVVLHDGTAAAHFQNETTGLVNGAAGARGGFGGASNTQLGTFYNAGTVAMSQGAFEVKGLTSVNNFTLTNSKLTVAGDFAVSGGTFGFTGTTASIAQDTGTLLLPTFASINASGNVVLSAIDGAVSVDGTVNADQLGIVSGNLTAYTLGGTAGPFGGGIQLNGSVSANKVALENWGTAGITQSAALTAQELKILSPDGAVNLGNAGNAIQNLSISARSLDLTNSTALTIKTLSTGLMGNDANQFFTTGSPAVPVALYADGDVAITNGAAVAIAGPVSAGSLNIQAVGNITAAPGSPIVTSGQVNGNSGDVFLNSTAGSINVGAIDTAAAPGASGAFGGTVVLYGQSVTAGNITTDGYNNASSFSPGFAGGVTVSAGTGGVVLGNISAKGGSGGLGAVTGGGYGGPVSLTSTNGDISVGTVTATGGSGAYGGVGGSVSMTALNGTVTAGAIDASGGAGGGTAFGNSGGGSINLSALGAIDTQGLSANGTTGTYGTRGGSISLNGGSAAVHGAIQASGASGDFGGGYGGTVVINSAAGISLNTAINAQGGSATSSGTGGFGGFVSLGASGGAVQLVNVNVYGGDSASGSGASGGSFLLTGAATSITGDANIDAHGGSGTQGGGSSSFSGISMTFAGSAALGTLNASGGNTSGSFGSAGDGGPIYLDNTAGAGAITTKSLLANGGNGGTSSVSGGQVTVLASGNIQVNGSIDSAGSGDSQFGFGGGGGSITLASSAGNVGVTGSINSSGGAAYAGGYAGDIDISAAGAVSLGSILARGGAGGSLGGSGGNVTVTAGGAVSTGSIDLSGADGTYDGGDGGTLFISGSSVQVGNILAKGGNGASFGGWGGDATLVGTAGPVSTGDINLSGGAAFDALFDESAGWSGSLGITGGSVTVGSITTQGGSGGIDGGYGADVSLVATAGNIVVNGWIDSRGGNGVTAGSGGYVTLNAAGGSVTVGSYIDTSAGFGSTARGDFAGDVTINSAGPAVLGSDVAAESAAGFATLYFAGTGTLSGSYVGANVYNEGTIAPGSASNPIGTFTVAGNYTQTATGRLLFDVADTVPYIPGVTYDQLRVFGTMDLAGSIEVNKVAAPPVTASPPPALLDQVSAAALSPPVATPTVVLLNSDGTATGGFSSISSPSAFASVLQMSANNVLTNLVVTNITDPPLPPAPPPAAPPGTPLVERIYQLLNQEVTRDLVQQALTEQDTVVTKFVSLLLKEEQDQADEAKEQGKPDIVSTDASCKPSS